MSPYSSSGGLRARFISYAFWEIIYVDRNMLNPTKERHFPIHSLPGFLLSRYVALLCYSYEISVCFLNVTLTFFFQTNPLH